MDKIHLGPRKVLRAPALRRGREIIPISDRVKLDRVLGFTVSSNAAFDCDPNSSIVAYPAGCVVVVYNVRKNKQGHILSSSKKTITSLAFSSDGKYLATGECGHLPHLRVWDVQEKVQVAEFQGHKYGINCVAFSPNLKYVVSVGSQHDMIVNVWDWKNNVKVASNKVSCKVKAVSFSANGNYFVTVGNRHVKFWYLEYSRSAKYKMEPVPLMGRSAILGDQRNNNFCDVACGKGKMSESTYAITKSGLLCEFNSRRLLDKWVELRTTSANSISIGEQYIFIGCAEGIIRCFSPTDLNFKCTLPRPHFLGVDVSKGVIGTRQTPPPSGKLKHPDTVAIAADEINNKVTCIYNDHSFYVWDIKDMKKIGKSHSFMYHSACIWGIETYPDLPEETSGILPKGTFLTCSSDDTIRIWNTELGTIQGTAYQRSIYSPELLKVLYVDPELTYLCDTDFNPSGSNDKVDTTYDGKNGVRCLRISPNGKHLASGDRSGNIRIHDLEFYEELFKVEAHDSEVLCLEYSKPVLVGGNEKEYLASASRDRLIHVFDVKEDYAFQQTLDDHSSSITAVRFVHNGNMLQMISCGADKSIIFRKAQFNPHLAFIREHHVVGKTTLYDMEVDNQQQHILTACQDRNIRVYSVTSGKHGRCFRGSQGEDGTLIKVILDPSGTYLATSCTDKSLYVYDYYSGECLASMFGHSELVTGLKFTNNGSHLISVSGDSCIFLWKLPTDLTQTMLNKQSPSDTTLPNLWHESRKGAIAITKPIQLSQNTSEDFNSNLVSSGNINEIHEPSPSAYRFSVGQLPLWAKKQMLDELKPSTVSSNKVTDPRMLPRCRWAQRIDGQGLVVRSYLDSDAVIPFPGNPGSEEGDSKMQNENKGALDGPEDGVVYRTKNEDHMSFEVSEQSLMEIKSGNVTQETGGIMSKPSLRDTFPFNRELGDLSTAAGNMRLEDMDAEDERSDSEISEMVYYPASEDGSDAPDSTFRVCANVNNGLKDAQDTSKRFPSRERPYGDTSTNNASEQLETNSDDEDLSTPADSERSFLGSLCISTENLEKLDQREKFMKSNYESLERNDNTGMKDGEIEDRSLYRQSISAKFLAGSLCCSLRPVTSGRVTPSFPGDQKAITPTRKREELNKALSETRKKLETVGFRRGLMSSKSIGDLHNIPGRDSQKRMFFGTQDSDIRRAASMNDLSNSSSPRRRLFSNPGSTRETTDGSDSAPLWSPKKSKENLSVLGKTESSSAYTSTLSSSALINGDKMSNKAETSTSSAHSIVTPSSAKSRNFSLPSTLHKTPVGSAAPQYKQSSYSTLVGKGLSSLNSVANRRTNLPSLIAQRHVVTATSVPLATDSSSDSSPTESSPKPLVAPSFVYVPNELGNETPLSKFSSNEHSTATNSFQSLKHRRIISRSEWDLKSFDDSKDNVFSHHNVPRFVRRQCLSESLHHAESDAKSHPSLRLSSSLHEGQGDQPTGIVLTLPGDPASVPITKELCEGISENLKKVTTCAIQVYQRLTLNSELPVEERNIMTDILAKGVWQAQQTLRPAIPPVPSWHASSGFEGNALNPRRLPGLGVPPGELHGLPSQHSSSVEPHIDNMDTMALLQQFSDKLLNIVQQKINSGSQEQSNT